MFGAKPPGFFAKQLVFVRGSQPGSWRSEMVVGLGRGLLVGVAIGVLGGIYPAWRVTRMTPLKALSGT